MFLQKYLKKKNSKFIKVKNTTEFLNQFAKLKREQSFAKIISITGSAGKTSLKNLLKDLLQNFGQTFSSLNLTIIILEFLSVSQI